MCVYTFVYFAACTNWCALIFPQVYLGKYKIPQLTMLKKFVLVLEAWEDRTFLDCTKVIEAAPQLTEFELNVSVKFYLAIFSFVSQIS